MEAHRQPENRLKGFLRPPGGTSRARSRGKPHRVKAAAHRHGNRTTGHSVYANDNPVRFTDPDGRCPDTDFGCGQLGRTIASHPEAFAGAAPYAAAAAGIMAAGPLAGVAIEAAITNPATAVNIVNTLGEALGGDALGGGTLAAGDYVATKGAARAIEILRPEGGLIGRAGSSSKTRFLQGSQAEAKSFFTQLVHETGATPVAKRQLDGFAVLPDGGGTIGYRAVSSSGPPTIDTKIPGLGIRELKFIDER